MQSSLWRVLKEQLCHGSQRTSTSRLPPLLSCPDITRCQMSGEDDIWSHDDDDAVQRDYEHSCGEGSSKEEERLRPEQACSPGSGESGASSQKVKTFFSCDLDEPTSVSTRPSGRHDIPMQAAADAKMCTPRAADSEVSCCCIAHSAQKVDCVTTWADRPSSTSESGSKVDCPSAMKDQPLNALQNAENKQYQATRRKNPSHNPSDVECLIKSRDIQRNATDSARNVDYLTTRTNLPLIQLNTAGNLNCLTIWKDLSLFPCKRVENLSSLTARTNLPVNTSNVAEKVDCLVTSTYFPPNASRSAGSLDCLTTRTYFPPNIANTPRNLDPLTTWTKLPLWATHSTGNIDCLSATTNLPFSAMHSFRSVDYRITRTNRSLNTALRPINVNHSLTMSTHLSFHSSHSPENVDFLTTGASIQSSTKDRCQSLGMPPTARLDTCPSLLHEDSSQENSGHIREDGSPGTTCGLAQKVERISRRPVVNGKPTSNDPKKPLAGRDLGNQLGASTEGEVQMQQCHHLARVLFRAHKGKFTYSLEGFDDDEDARMMPDEREQPVRSLLADNTGSERLTEIVTRCIAEWAKATGIPLICPEDNRDEIENKHEAPSLYGEFVPFGKTQQRNPEELQRLESEETESQDNVPVDWLQKRMRGVDRQDRTLHVASRLPASPGISLKCHQPSGGPSQTLPTGHIKRVWEKNSAFVRPSHNSPAFSLPKDFQDTQCCMQQNNDPAITFDGDRFVDSSGLSNWSNDSLGADRPDLLPDLESHSVRGTDRSSTKAGKGTRTTRQRRVFTKLKQKKHKRQKRKTAKSRSKAAGVKGHSDHCEMQDLHLHSNSRVSSATKRTSQRKISQNPPAPSIKSQGEASGVTLSEPSVPGHTAKSCLNGQGILGIFRDKHVMIDLYEVLYWQFTSSYKRTERRNAHNPSCRLANGSQKKGRSEEDSAIQSNASTRTLLKHRPTRQTVASRKETSVMVWQEKEKYVYDNKNYTPRLLSTKPLDSERETVEITRTHRQINLPEKEFVSSENFLDDSDSSENLVEEQDFPIDKYFLSNNSVPQSSIFPPSETLRTRTRETQNPRTFQGTLPENSWSKAPLASRRILQPKVLHMDPGRLLPLPPPKHIRLPPIQFSHKIKTKHLWRRAALRIILVRRIADISNARRHKDCAKTFIDLMDEEKCRFRQMSVSFSPSDFVTNKEMMLSRRVLQTLSTPPVYRTDDDIRQVVNGLRFLREFSAYPSRVQEQLAKIGWYMRVEPQRVILRQGHSPVACYFILGGQAVAKSELMDETFALCGRVETIMRQGTCFGELAVLYNQRRLCTVTSRTTVHLLWVLGEDFLDIFRGPPTASGILPDHVQFLGKLDLMRDWPLTQLYDNSSYCRAIYFRKNSVIVEDSRQSDWLYIVRSFIDVKQEDLSSFQNQQGTCQVIMLVPEVKLTKRDLATALQTGKKTFEEMSEGLSSTYLGWITGRAVAKVDSGLPRQQHRVKNVSALWPPPRHPADHSPTTLSNFASGLGKCSRDTDKKSLALLAAVTPVPLLRNTRHGSLSAACFMRHSFLYLGDELTSSAYTRRKPLPCCSPGYLRIGEQQVVQRQKRMDSTALVSRLDKVDGRIHHASLAQPFNPSPPPTTLLPPLPTRRRSRSPKSICKRSQTEASLSRERNLLAESFNQTLPENAAAMKTDGQALAEKWTKSGKMTATPDIKGICGFAQREGHSSRSEMFDPTVHFCLPEDRPTEIKAETMLGSHLRDGWRCDVSSSQSPAIELEKHLASQKRFRKSKWVAAGSSDDENTRKSVKYIKVVLQELQEQDIFGLDQIPSYPGALVTSPSTCLISKGAECILLHKKFFMKHAPPLLHAQLYQCSCEYPDPKQVTRLLIEDQYHRQFLQHLLKNMASKELIRSSVHTPG